MLGATRTRRSGEAVDAGVPLSDVIRDPRSEKLSDDAIAREIRYRWQSSLDWSSDLRLRQWPRNVLMTYTDGDVQWSPRAERWLAVQVRRARRYKTSLLPSRVAYFAARMTQSTPEWTAIPGSDGIEDEETAKLCEKVLRFAYREQRIDLARYFAIIQMCLFGFGLLETKIDDEASVEVEYEMETNQDGTPVFDPGSGTPVYVLDGKGRPRIKGVANVPGIKVAPVSPFSFVVPPGMEWPLVQDAPYCIRATWLSEQYIRRRYEVSDDKTLTSDSYGTYQAMVSYLGQIMAPQSAQRFESGRLLVLQYYEHAKDVKSFEEGKVYTVCGDQLIGNERSLFDDGRYPFFMFPWMPVTDSFYAFPWLNPQVDPQSRIDQTITHMMDHLARVGSPNVVADRGSGFTPKPVFGYKVLFTSPGMRRPEFMQAPTMPTGAYEMMSQATRDLDQTGMSYPLARGEAQKGITSGLHARMIQDADQTEMGPVARMHAAEFARMGESLLDLYRDYGPEDKMLSIAGPDGVPQFFAFKRNRLPIGQRVVVQEESLLVHYRSALEERATQLGGAGAFGNLMTDSNAREQFRRAVRDPHLAGPLTPEEIQKQYLDVLHFRIIHKREEIEKTEPWWNLAAHRAAAHERLTRESLQWDEETKTRFMHYWLVIEQAVAKVEQERAQAQAQAEQAAIAAEGKVADLQANAKAKVELLRGTTKLAVESMKSGEGGAGAGAGAASMSSAFIGNDESGQGPSENEGA